mmetsp:Transcript_11357/g.16471  ORF Transcript_11357/g.16471 Transcript_11357/m.16471 type:complete len:567 (-) Transcript_11357:80-1780(-)
MEDYAIESQTIESPSPSSPTLKKKKKKKKSSSSSKKSSSSSLEPYPEPFVAPPPPTASYKGVCARYKKPIGVLLVGAFVAFTFVLSGTTSIYDSIKDLTSSSSEGLWGMHTSDAERSDRLVEIVEDLRFLSIGASRAVTSDGTSSEWYNSYPYLLSPDPSKITHLADGVSGPRYPSVCIQSLVAEAMQHKVVEKEHDMIHATDNLHGIIDNPAVDAEDRNEALTSDEYDVIILNYFMQAWDGLYDLAKRLRNRYPDAIIVMVRVWKPAHISWYKDNLRMGNLRDWSKWQDVGFDTIDFFTEISKNPNLDLRWQMIGNQGRDDLVASIIKDFGAHLYKLPYHEDPKVSIVESRHLFSQDFTRLSTEGHHVISLGILGIVYRQFNSYPRHPRIGTWGDGDVCHSWYMSGDCPLERSPNLVMEKFKSIATQYALSTGMDNPSDTGWIVVENPFATERNFILSYMVSGPPPSIYPEVVIRIYHAEEEGGEEIEIATEHIDPTTLDYNAEVHTVATTKVGRIPPGKSRVYWAAKTNRRRPFRIVATQVVGDGFVTGGILGPSADYSHMSLY